MTDHEDCTAKIASLNQTIIYLQAQLAAYGKDVARVSSIKEEFVTMISHDLRTPVTIIRECLSQLQDGLFGEVNAEQAKLLQLAMQNLDRLTGCINQYIERLRSEKPASGDLNKL